jgi:hypothetical protein
MTPDSTTTLELPKPAPVRCSDWLEASFQPTIENVGLKEAKRFCVQWHYSNIFPPHCMITLGYRDAKGLAGVALWGWGVRPMHTIKKLFPSLATPDYWELNRLCLRDDCVKNSESWFLARCAEWMKVNQPKIKVLLSWADGVRGKPGYIYQAAGWLYGGSITTEIYTTKDGEPVHPRMMITRYGTRNKELCAKLGLQKIWGEQFIYARFLCGHKERKALLKETTVKWSQDYPKRENLRWTIQAGEVSRETCDAPSITRSGQFRHPAPTLFDEPSASADASNNRITDT